ncbi:MAG TPA: PEP/pyruvate-binding domain-containing protein, partial [Anaerolineaceae bacterium]
MISNPLTLPLDSPLASLELAGGKGMSLARLSRAGFPVPGGWILTTQAYHAFVDFNRIGSRIEDGLAGLGADDLDRLEELSGRIRGWFAEGELPEEIRAAILAAHSTWMEVPVAVRSSATAEDLPGLSFAGQQETFLNVTGEEALLRAVVGCWSSLWTARAASYRARNGVPQAGVGLAVVVQRMIESQASGVLFTANPLTGLITETVIDATLGLGEALVSGKVEPDHYVVDAYAGRITHKTLGAKALSIRSTAAGGTVTQDESASGIQALPDEQILALAQMGRRAAAEAGSPQDIEWAWAGGQLSLLQSRPITSLFPLPEGMSPEPLKVMLSFGAVQGINDPLTPLGRDMFSVIAASAAHLFRLGVTRETQNVFFSAGERAWVNLTTLIRNTIGRKGLHAGLGFGEPAVRQVVEALWDDPRLAPPHQGLTLRGVRQVASFLVPVLGNTLLNLVSPDARRKFIVGRAEQILVEMRARAASLQGDRRERLEGLLRAYFDLIDHRLGPMFVRFLSGVASGILPWTVLNSFARQLSGQPEGKNAAGFQDLVLEISRGLPNNPTTEMDLELWQAAQAVRADPASREAFAGTPPVELARLYEAGGLPPAAQAAFDRFLDRYGGRGLAEIDLGRPRWREDPAHIFEVVSGYLLLENPDQAPDAVFARGAVRAGEATDQLVNALRKTRRGWFKARVARFAASRARAMMGMRESPKFFVVRLLAIFRW